MHILLIPLLADDSWVAPSGATVIAIMYLAALFRGR